MLKKIKAWIGLDQESNSPPNNNNPYQDYLDPITKAALESGFNDDRSLQKDTEILERVLIVRHGVWLFPHRCTSLSGGKDNLLRYRHWLPPVVITPAEKTVKDFKNTPIFFPNKEINFPKNLERGTSTAFNKEYDIFVNPVALDLLLTRIIPISDPRYYRIFKEVSFDLCHKLANKTKLLFGGGQNGDFFPDYLLEFDEVGNVISETFEEVLTKQPFKSPNDLKK